MRDKTTLELAFRINKIEKEIYDLEMEYNQIVEELKNRIPSLKDDVNIQPKKKVRKYENNNI